MLQATFSAARGGFREPAARRPGRRAISQSRPQGGRKLRRRAPKRSPIHSSRSVFPPRGPRGDRGARIRRARKGPEGPPLLPAAGPLPPPPPLRPAWASPVALPPPQPPRVPIAPNPRQGVPLTCLSRCRRWRPDTPPFPTCRRRRRRRRHCCRRRRPCRRPRETSPGRDDALPRPDVAALPNQARCCLSGGGTHARREHVVRVESSAFSVLGTRALCRLPPRPALSSLARPPARRCPCWVLRAGDWGPAVQTEPGAEGLLHRAA